MNTPPASTAIQRPTLRLRDCYWFFAPLVFMVELNMISKSVIHGFLARTEAPSVALAAFNAGFTFYFAIASAAEVATLLCLAHTKSRPDLRRLMAFMAVVMSVPVAMTWAVAFTSLGDMVFGGWFGLGAEARHDARSVIWLLTLSAPVLILRGFAFGLLMMSRRTLIITASTLVRLLSLTVSLAVLPLWLEGAAIGAAALVACMATETVFAWCFARRQAGALPHEPGNTGTYSGYWRFSWPLIVNASAETGVIFVINLFLGRLEHAELGIAAFGVVHGLVSLLLAPMRNLSQTAQTLVTRREDVRTLTVFTAQLVMVFMALGWLCFHTPLRRTILSGAMGLTPELSAQAEPALALSIALAVFWSCTALFRGLLAKAGTTKSLAVSGVLRIATATIAASIGMTLLSVDGALLGVAAWTLSYMVETMVSAWRLRKLGWYAAT